MFDNSASIGMYAVHLLPIDAVIEMSTQSHTHTHENAGECFFLSC